MPDEQVESVVDESESAVEESSTNGEPTGVHQVPVVDDNGAPASESSTPEQTAFSHESPSKPVSVRLSDSDMAERAVQIASLIGERERLVERKKASAKSMQAQIDSLDEEIARMGRTILDGNEERKQGDLFAQDVSTSTAEPQWAGEPNTGSAPEVLETTQVNGEQATLGAVEDELSGDTFVCALCVEDGRSVAGATFAKSESAFVDSEARRICPDHHAQIQVGGDLLIALDSATSQDGVFNFDSSEPPPQPVGTIEKPPAPKRRGRAVKRVSV